MDEDLAELVLGDLATEGPAAAETGHARDGVGRRSAGGFNAGGHARIDLAGAVLVDQLHAALEQLFGGQEGVVGRGDDVDDGVADGGDVVEGGHAGGLFGWSFRGAFYRRTSKRAMKSSPADTPLAKCCYERRRFQVPPQTR